MGGPVGHVERPGQRSLFDGRRLQQPFECRRRLQITDAKLPAALQHKQVTISLDSISGSQPGYRGTLDSLEMESGVPPVIPFY